MKLSVPALLLLGAATVFPAGDGYAPPPVEYKNTPYNGRFTFVRIRFEPSDWGPGRYMWGLDLKWNHDYPRAEAHFMKMLQELTTLNPNHGRRQHPGPRRPRAVQVPGGLPLRAGLLDPQRRRGRRAFGRTFSREGS